MDILIATSNQGKVNEYKKILKDFDFNFYSLKDLNIDVDVEENGKTFKENSIIKAKEYHRLSNMACISDDSGLNVKALPNILGIETARFLGKETSYPDKAKEIIRRLETKKNRSAYFTCVITFVDSRGKIKSFTGIKHGKIANDISGTHGFGFDICFIPRGYKETFATLDESVKTTIGHRALASKKLIRYMRRHKDEYSIGK